MRYVLFLCVVQAVVTSFDFCQPTQNTSEICSPVVVTAMPSPETNWWAYVDFEQVAPFWINTHDPHNEDIYISGSAHAKRIWDIYIWDTIVRIAKPAQNNSLIIDVGANIGYFSLMAASLGHSVIAFEPMEKNLRRFVSSIDRNGFKEQIKVFRHALSSVACQQVNMQPTHHTNQGNGQIQGSGGDILTMTLDNIIQQDILLMKIDVEGFETAVLDGGSTLLTKYNVQNIVMEFSDTTKHTCDVAKMLQTMRGLGYFISDVVENAPLLDVERIESFPPNILFSKKSR